MDETPKDPPRPLARLRAALGLDDGLEPSTVGEVRVPLAGPFDAAAAQAELERLRAPSPVDPEADRREAAAVAAELEASAGQGQDEDDAELEADARANLDVATRATLGSSAGVSRAGCAIALALFATLPAALVAAGVAGTGGPAGPLVILAGAALGGVAGWVLGPRLLGRA